MDQDLIGFNGLTGIGDRWQRLPLNHDLLSGMHGHKSILRHDQGNCFSDMAHLWPGQNGYPSLEHRLAILTIERDQGIDRPKASLLQICSGNDGLDAGAGQGARQVNRYDCGVCIGAANKDCMTLMGEVEIARVGTITAHKIQQLIVASVLAPTEFWTVALRSGTHAVRLSSDFEPDTPRCTSRISSCSASSLGVPAKTKRPEAMM